jgi:hypothetical protein
MLGLFVQSENMGENMKTTEFIPVFVEGELPSYLEEGFLYISESRRACTHLCACGCKGETYLPFKRTIAGQERYWDYTNNNGIITLNPSIGNWAGQNPYHAHYFIRDNKVIPA